MNLKIGFSSDDGLLKAILVTKFIYIFLAEFVYRRFSELGDSSRYLNSEFRLGTDSTAIMDLLGFFAGKLPSPLYHLPMMLLSFYGISYLVTTLSKFGLIDSYNRRFCFFFLICLPSTGIWSSIHSKEAMGFFFVSIITAFLIKVNFRNIYRPNFIEFVAIILCVIFKAQYMVCFISLYCYISICRRALLSADVKLILFLMFIFIQFFLIYHFSSIIDQLSFSMHSHFDIEGARSTRDNIFYEKGDFFRHAPYGMLIAFWGPTFLEASLSFMKSIALVESFILSSILIYFVFLTFSRVLHGKLNVYFLGVLALGIFWILLVHYPFGIFNPGSALRYRTNFVPFLLGILLFTSNKSH